MLLVTEGWPFVVGGKCLMLFLVSGRCLKLFAISCYVQDTVIDVIGWMQESYLVLVVGV